jgi:hypothetical protein
VLLLPYLDHNQLHQQFRLNEPWDSPHNLALLAKMPREYQSSWAEDNPNGTTTRFQVFVGPGTMFDEKGVKVDDLRNGTGHTFLVAESAQPVPWAKPEDMVYDSVKPLPALAIHRISSRPTFFNEIFPFLRPRKFAVGFADTHVEFIDANNPEETIRSHIQCFRYLP